MRAFSTVAFVVLLSSVALAADKKYDTGASDQEIKIGQTAPYSGPVSAAGVIGKTGTAYFNMVNANGGINGRKINYISLDDAYSPSKTVEQIRKLVEQDDVLYISNQVGTPTSASVQKYLNGRQIPQLFIGSGATRWNNPKEFPWTSPFTLSAEIEMGIYAKYIRQQIPNAKIGILFQNDDFGKDYVRSFKKGLGENSGASIVKEVSYESSDPTIDSQIVSLKASGANVFLDITTPKFGAQSIRKAHEIGWTVPHFVTSSTVSIEGTLKPAGLELAQGIITASVWKEPLSDAYKDDAGVQEYLAFSKKWNAGVDPADVFAMQGYTVAQLTAAVLKECGDNLTRANILKQATSLKGIQLSLIRPGILASNSPEDYNLFHQVQLMRFKDKNWEPMDGLLSFERQP